MFQCFSRGDRWVNTLYALAKKTYVKGQARDPNCRPMAIVFKTGNTSFLAGVEHSNGYAGGLIPRLTSQGDQEMKQWVSHTGRRPIYRGCRASPPSVIKLHTRHNIDLVLWWEIGNELLEDKQNDINPAKKKNIKRKNSDWQKIVNIQNVILKCLIVGKCVPLVLSTSSHEVLWLELKHLFPYIGSIIIFFEKD